VHRKEIIEDENKRDNSARDVQEQMEDGEEILNPDNSSSEYNTDINTINNELEHESYDEAVRWLNGCLTRQLQVDCVPGK